MNVKFRPKILYIEDTPASRQLVSRLLGQEYIILEAADPLSGIELARHTNPDLILIDVNLPGMSGHEVATRLKTLFPETPLVALTADTSSGGRERALIAGCAGYLNKPIDPDTFSDTIAEFLGGRRDDLDESTAEFRAYQADLVERLETKIRELTEVAARNDYLLEQNRQIIALLQRRQRLLEASARVSHNITSILNLDPLLNDTVSVICDEFGFYFAGIFLLDANHEWVELRAGYGAAGAALKAEGFRVPVGFGSMVGIVVADRKARIALDVEEETSFLRHDYLPKTASEMVLPLIFKDTIFGALSVQSDIPNSFSDDDSTALQTLADQIAVAINNAQLMRDLDAATQELLRTKTFEAIATATGEAIHWVGNKAAPIPASAGRVCEDFTNLLAMIQTLFGLPDAGREAHPFWEVVQNMLAAAPGLGLDLPAQTRKLSELSPNAFIFLGDLESTLEDLHIIEQSARKILDIKEDLIGPARKPHLEDLNMALVLRGTINGMGLPAGIIVSDFGPDLPPVRADARQLDNVFGNLIKNAWEALRGQETPHIWVRASLPEPELLRIEVEDNGPGIPPDLLEKIWVSFFTTKGGQGGTGLGLAACMEIVRQTGGKIWAESVPGKGAKFIVLLPTVFSDS
ncbi:MAG: response regulator [Anaerolineales bacterium]|nr:response regulator [Anaerolineales bacterium]